MRTTAVKRINGSPHRETNQAFLSNSFSSCSNTSVLFGMPQLISSSYQSSLPLKFFFRSKLIIVAWEKSDLIFFNAFVIASTIWTSQSKHPLENSLPDPDMLAQLLLNQYHLSHHYSMSKRLTFLLYSFLRMLIIFHKAISSWVYYGFLLSLINACYASGKVFFSGLPSLDLVRLLSLFLHGAFFSSDSAD